MADSLKITTPVSAKGKIQGAQKQPSTDAVFELLKSEPAAKVPQGTLHAPTEPSGRTSVLDTGRAILQPLLGLAGGQAQQYMDLLTALRQLFLSQGNPAETLLENLFADPEHLLSELIRQDRGGTAFGSLSQELLPVAAASAQDPELKEAIAAILKHFDCRINRQSTLQGLWALSHAIVRKLPATTAAAGEPGQLHEILKTLILANIGAGENPGEVLRFLRNDYIPAVGKYLKEYPGSGDLRDALAEMIHYVVRLEQSEPEGLESAFSKLAQLMQMSEQLRDVDTDQMGFLLMQAAEEGLENDGEESTLLPVLKKALEESSPVKLNQQARELLLNLAQNENPILPFHRFVIPLRWGDTEILSEFIIDKDFRERKGNAEQAVSIFFTLQSEQFGVFEVDLLAKDHLIDLDIKCPEALASATVSLKTTIRGIVEAGGYRLGAYQTGVYRESRTILSRYPKLELERTGIDVKI